MRHVTILLLVAACTSLAPRTTRAHDSPYPHFHMRYDEMRMAIGKARQQLRDAEIGTAEVGGRNAVLAVWNPTGDRSKIRLVHVRDGASVTKGFTVSAWPWNGLTPQKSGEQTAATKGHATRRHGKKACDALPPPQVVDPYNGVNTRYAVDAPSDWFVLAIKSNTKSRAGAIYVPYSQAYHTPENVAEGRRYIEDVIRAAEKTIAERHVMSRMNPKLFVTDVLDRGTGDGRSLDADARVLFALLMIEHIDVDEFRARGAPWTADKVLVTLALNREDTYRYSVSSAAAGGIAQFISSTYADVRTRYPEARLPESFEDAMRDHVTAVVAQFCLIDRMLKALSDAGIAIPESRYLVGAYLAAGYNAGEHRAVPALRDFLRSCARRTDGRWCQHAHGLPAETVNYVREFGDVYAHLFH